MNTIHYLRSGVMFFGGLLLSTACWAETRQFAIPSYLVNSGAVVHVPITLDNASGLASIIMQVNFDENVLELEAVNVGPLGGAFEFSEAQGGGFVQLIFARPDELAGGSGRLASLRFRANPGAVVDLISELAIADLDVSDSTGVIDLRQTDALILSNGEVRVSALPNIDNAGSGLPDWWEIAHGFDPFTDNRLLDPDKDGIPNLLEYAFGSNPLAGGVNTRGVQSGQYQIDNEVFMKLGFHRRLGDALLLFRVQESTNLDQWTDLDLQQRIIGTPQNMGDGTEFVNVLGTLPITGPEAEPKGFLRVVVERPATP